MRLISATYHRSASVQGPFGYVLGALALALAALSRSAPRRRWRARRALVISGAGDGHGVGMSQEGALGYAEHGFSYEQILAHYYTGTALGQAPAGRMVKVLVGSKVKTLPLERYVRGVVAAEMPSELAARCAGGAGGREPHVCADLGCGRAEVRRLRGHALADVCGSGGGNGEPRTRRSRLRRGRSSPTRAQPGDDLLLRELGWADGDIQNAFLGAAPQPWLMGVPDPYDQGPQHTWT